MKSTIQTLVGIFLAAMTVLAGISAMAQTENLPQVRAGADVSPELYDPVYVRELVDQLDAPECALCSLVEKGETEIVVNLLALRKENSNIDFGITININGQDERGRSALLLAARYDYRDIVILLLNDPIERADPSIINHNRRTPLMWAAQNGNFEIANLLLDAGANPLTTKIAPDSRSALDFALQYENYDIGAELVFRGVSPSFAHNTFDFARSSQYRDFITFLLEAGTVETPYMDEPSILFWAVKNGFRRGVDAILADGGRCDITDANGITPRGIADIAEHIEISYFLEEQGCPEPTCIGDNYEWASEIGECKDRIIEICVEEDSHWIGGDYGCVPIPPLVLVLDEPVSFLEEYAATGGDLDALGVYEYYFHKVDSRIIDLLTGFFVNLPGNFDKFAFMVDNNASVEYWVAAIGGLGEIKILHNLAFIAQPGYPNDAQNRAQAFEYLIQNRSDLDVEAEYPRDSGDSSLGVMAYWGLEVHKTYVPLLITAGANVDHQNHSGTTPLIRSVYREHRWVTELLLEANADCNIANDAGETPWDYARGKEDTSVLQYLLDNCPTPEVQAAKSVDCDTTASATIAEDGSLVIDEDGEECANPPGYGPDNPPPPLEPPHPMIVLERL